MSSRNAFPNLTLANDEDMHAHTYIVRKRRSARDWEWSRYRKISGVTGGNDVTTVRGRHAVTVIAARTEPCRLSSRPETE